MTGKRSRQTDAELGDIVSILWVDSVCGFGWSPVHDDTNLEAKTVGYLVGFTDEKYVISSTIGPRGDCLSPLHIPRVSVRSIERLGAGGGFGEANTVRAKGGRATSARKARKGNRPRARALPSNHREPDSELPHEDGGTNHVAGHVPMGSGAETGHAGTREGNPVRSSAAVGGLSERTIP